jgi:hypothetical protein
VRQYERVVVHVHDAGIRGRLPGDLMSVLHDRQSGTDVEELPDPRVGGEVVDGSDKELPAFPGYGHDFGERRGIGIPGLAVAGEVVLAA